MQIAAVHVDVGPAEALLAGVIERDLVERLARVPGAADERVRVDARLQQVAFYAQAPQHLHDVGAEDDAGADAGEGGRLLVDRDGKALALQEGRARQSAEASTDDGNPVPRFNPAPRGRLTYSAALAGGRTRGITSRESISSEAFAFSVPYQGG